MQAEGEHSAMLLTFMKLPFVIKIFGLSIFEWPFYTDFTVVLIINVNGLQADDSNKISSLILSKN